MYLVLLAVHVWKTIVHLDWVLNMWASQAIS